MDRSFEQIQAQFGMTGADKQGLTPSSYVAQEENKGTIMQEAGDSISRIADEFSANLSKGGVYGGLIAINDTRSKEQQQADAAQQYKDTINNVTMGAVDNFVPSNGTSIWDGATQRFFGKSESQIRAEEALQIAKQLNIGADVVMNTSDDGFRAARIAAGRVTRGETLDEVQQSYPELATLNYASQADAINILSNLENVKRTRGIIDSVQQNIWSMNDQMKLGELGSKLAFADEKEKASLIQQINEVQDRLDNYRHDDESNFLGRIVGETAGQGYMMGKQAVVGGGIGGAIGMAGGALLGAAIGRNPSTAAQFGLQGAKLLGQAGMAEQMAEMSFGLKYMELINKKDAEGNRIYSDSEARNRAAAFATIDTGVEFYAMKLGAKAVTKATPASRMAAQALTTGVDTTVATMNKGMGAVVGQAMKRGVQAGIPELVEEGLQDANEKIQHNLFRKDNDPEGTYSVGDIASGALGAMAQAAPSVIGLTGLGGLAGGIRVAHDLRKWNSLTVEQQNAALQAEQNRNAQALMANIRNDAKTNKLAKDNPEVYGQLVQKYAQNAQVPTAYVNVHELVETPEGQNAIREMVDAGIVSDEDVAKSIEAETPIEVPLGQFAQKATNLSDNAMEAMKDTTYYTEGGRSMQTIEKDKEAYAQAQQDVSNELKNHKANVKQEIIAEHFPDATESQKEVLNEVLDAPDDVKRTYNAAVLQAQTDFREKYNSEYQNFQMAKKNGLDISPESEDDNGSNVTIAEKERMGVIDYNRRLELEMAKNDLDATEIINQKYDNMVKEAKAISELESMSDHIDKIADSEVAMKMNFTKEGYQVFQDVYQTLQQATNTAVSESAKESALLFASHADVMANIMQKAGKWDFTAKDYMDQYISIQTGGQVNEQGLTQEAVASAESKLKADTEAWGKFVDKLDSYNNAAQVRVMTTPLAMQLAGAKPYEVVMGVGKIRKILKDHPEITKDGLKNLIQQLADPIAVFESKTQKGSIVAIVQLKYPVNNANVVIPIKLDADSSRGTYKVNVITSAYARYNKETLEPSISWYKNRFEGKEDTALYLNTKKITDWYSVTRLQLPLTEYHISDFFDYNIPNEEDLRKLKDARPGMYQNDATVNGMTSLMANDRKLVDLFETADFSTFVHESGHVFLEDLRMLATMEGAPEQVINDWEEVKKWTGYQEGTDADTNRNAHEKFAQGFEAYVRDGSAPTQALQRAFRQFAQWLTRIYQKVSMLGGKPPKAIRDVMDRMLATEQDIEAWATDREIDRLETKVNMRELSEAEQAALNNKVANIKERAKEKVRAEYVKELEEREVIPWDKVKDKAQDKIERQLVEQYPIYKERMRYEAFGVDALANTEHPTLQSLEEAEETKGIGKWHDVVNAQLESAKEAYEESNRTTVDNATLAEEWLLTHQAEQRLRLAEAEMIKDDIRKASARHYRALAKLQKIDTSKGDIELQLKQALGDLTDRERNRIERELGKEAIADTKRSATDKEHDKMQAKFDKAEQASSNKIEKLESKHQDILEKVNAKHQAQVTALKNVISKHMLQLRDLKNMHNETLSASMKKAEAKLSKLTVSQATKYKRFVRESVTAGKKADIAFSKAKPYLAYSLKQEQLMKTSMARVSFEINQEITKERTKLLKQLQRIGSANSTVKLDPQSRYWYQHMMYQLGISTRDGMMPADGNFDLPSVYAVLDADALLSDGSTKEVVPPSVGTVWFSKTPMDYTQMSVSDFREVAEVMNAIYHNSRTEYQASTIKDDKGNAISVNQAAQELVEQASKTMGGIPDQNLLDKLNSETWKAKTSNSVSGKLLELAKAETILNRFDGGQKGGGVWYRYIYEPINRATNDAKERTEIAMKWLSSAISNSYSKKELFNIRNVKGYKLGDVSNMTKEQVIAAALNWGTEANRQRVLETFNTTEVEVEKAFADILNDKDWNFIESTWNHINSYFDERNQVQERLYGTPMKKEQGVKFAINGRDIEGQYYPIVYDPKLDGKSSDYEIEDIIKSQMSSNAVMGMGLSATKQRMATVKGKKLLLSLDVIPSAITESINHIAMREAVTDVNKLIQHHEVENAIVQTLGRDVHQYLKQWVRDNWQTEISKTSLLDRTLNKLRKNSTTAIMMFRTSTALLNILNTIPAMHKMGAINALSAVKSFYFGGPLENRRFVMSKSVFLRERIQNLDKDMKNGMKIDGKSPFNTGTVVDSAAWKTSEMQEAVNRYGYFFITETDLMLSMPIWMHEYEAKKAELIGKEGYSPDEIESRAIEAGDRMVRSIFGSGDVKDQAAIQRKNSSVINLFTPFYSYSNTVLNAVLESVWLSKDSGNWWKAAHSLLFWVLLPAVGEALLRSLWDDDKDDVDTITKKSIKSIGSSTVQGFPLIRDILGAVGSAITGDSTTSRGSEVVALSMTSKLSKTFGDALFRQGKVHPTDVGRGATEVVNRLVPGGFSDTLTDGAWTMAKWLLTDTDATVLDLATAIAMDKKIRTREEQKKHNAFVKRQEHKK